MNPRIQLAALAICLVCSRVRGETYTWTGGSGTDNRWSNPLNWESGVVPVSATDSLIIFDPIKIGGGSVYQDLGDNFDVGTLYAIEIPFDLPSSYQSITIRGDSLRIHQAAINMQGFYGYANYSSIQTVGNVSLDDQISIEHPETGWPRFGGYFPGHFELGGNLTINGGWRIDDITGTGSIHVNLDASLDGIFVNTQLESISGSGWLDLEGSIRMIGGIPADLTDATLDLGRVDSTYGATQIATTTIDGDVALGNWIIRGSGGSYAAVDRLNVTGELNLIHAQIDPDSLAMLPLEDAPDHFVLATYGNRVGAFPQMTLNWSDLMFGPTHVGQIHYTSGENDGVGEVWLIIPEPGLLTSLAILLPLTLRGRR